MTAAQLGERVEAWMRLLGAGALDRVEAEIDAFELDLQEANAADREAPEAALRRVRAELAQRDHGPLSDLLRAAAGDHADRGRWLLEAVRRLGRIDGQPLVVELLEEAKTAEGCGAAAVRMLAAAERTTAIDPDPARAEILDALAAGRRVDARAIAQRWAERSRAHLVLSALAGEDADWAEAARELERAIRERPESDDVLRNRNAMGLAYWAAGELDLARTSFRTLRDDTRDIDDGFARYLHHEAIAVLEPLDHATAAPRWIRIAAPPDRPLLSAGGRGALGLLGWVDPELQALPEAPTRFDADDHPTAAHVRRSLDAAGIAYARSTLTEEAIEAALRSGAWVVVEEERPIDTGFVWIRGFAPDAALLEVVEPTRVGPSLRRYEEQAERGALFAMSGFVVWGRGDEAARRRATAEAAHPCLAHQDALDLLDACDLDENGEPPPRARVDALAAQALEGGTPLPMLHRRRGEALLDQLRSGDIQPQASGKFEGWLADTREQFPDAEWPFQLYARALELQGRNIEACIAWKDAGLRDRHDYRNALGQARALSREGDLWPVYRALRKASALAPEVGEIEGMLAINAMHRNDAAKVRVHARLARALDPDDARAMVASASVAEQAGDFDEAVALFKTLVERDDIGEWAPTRLARRHAAAGRWCEARDVATAACTRFPAAGSVWIQAAELALADGDCTAALELACAGIDRCGAADSLIELALDAAIFGAAPGQHHEAVRAIVGRVLLEPHRTGTIVRRLIQLPDEAFAVEVARNGAAAFGRDLEGPWLLVRSLLRTRATRSERMAEVGELLETLLPHCGSFPYPRIFAALEALARGEATTALEVLGEADVQRVPVLTWELTARALDAEDKGPAAEALRARLVEGYPNGVTDEVGFLRTHGYSKFASELLDAMVASRGEEPDSLIELARCRAAMGDPAAAYDLLTRADNTSTRVDPEELAAVAERVGRWDAVGRCAQRLVGDLERDSSWDGDVWVWRAVAAGVALESGDPGPRARLIEAAPRHIRAWRRLVRIERAAGLREADADHERLAALSPGAAAGLDSEEPAWLG